MLSNPIEQFNIVSLIPFNFMGFRYNISLTNSSLFMIITCFTIVLVTCGVISFKKVFPNNWQVFVESIYDFLFTNIVTEINGKKGRLFFPLIFTLFLFISIGNLIGMVPFSFTFTSHIVITLGLSLSFFIGLTITGIYMHGFHFLSLFVPKGVPIVLLPLLFVIEFISYVSRGFSLAIRLFANMMAGHALVKILAGFAYVMLTANGIIPLLEFIPIFIITAIYVLEIGVAILQAYVFSVLICIYLNDTLYLH
uniref:ATP synthase subunit a n=1 Tax=Cyanophora biloba TaxID=1489483 RepID=A0A873WY58_9EUKA|nr:ATP synthase F0 subunit a [Cyanophora biloba]QPB15012.1 ATP synthase F0 subunit a [Cyanophora biloba]